ncbi:hypothetical protein L6164_028925 [Bauhinia variegata]|uniref:Uncharacterized protein n=1 Tax=Bauhinia variegata TaxID=167791 RepID=A0ACB9L831_BAUVA|nr:hypothetical protein L6164_028925 [Bauhinia variegata]
MIPPIQSPFLKLLVSLHLLFSLGYGFAFEGDETTENLQFHTIQVSSLQPSSTCDSSTEGSYLTWTQCKAPSGHYFKQKHPLFDPLKSKTFKRIKCSSPLCPGDESKCSSSNLCGFASVYGDNSTTEGDYSRDRLTLTNFDVIDNFFFGCAVKNIGIFHESEEDGMLGLSQYPLSIVKQTAKKHHQLFSYCIPSKPGFTGYLRFGGKRHKRLMYTTTTNYQNRTYYGIDMIGISVGGKKLPIPQTVFTKAGSIIDSGTGITRLPTNIYIPFRDAYRKAMSKYKFVNPSLIWLILAILLATEKHFSFQK